VEGYDPQQKKNTTVFTCVAFLYLHSSFCFLPVSPSILFSSLLDTSVLPLGHTDAHTFCCATDPLAAQRHPREPKQLISFSIVAFFVFLPSAQYGSHHLTTTPSSRYIGARDEEKVAFCAQTFQVERNGIDLPYQQY
jgi:hypothetical protein